MAPTQIREPFHRDGWVFEEKVDGWRMVAYKDDDHVQLVSRNGVDHTWRFADVAAAIAKLCCLASKVASLACAAPDTIRSIALHSSRSLG